MFEHFFPLHLFSNRFIFILLHYVTLVACHQQWPCSWSGGCHVFISKFYAELAVCAIERHTLTSFITVPAIMASLISIVRYVVVSNSDKTLFLSMRQKWSYDTTSKNNLIFYPVVCCKVGIQGI